MKTNITTVVAFCLTVACMPGQGTFRNLDFEDAKVTLAQQVSDALPGWFAYSGTNQMATIGYNTGGAAYPSVLLEGSPAGGTNPVVIGGIFSVLITQAGSDGSGAISQSGYVPPDAQTLFFKAFDFYGNSSLAVTLGAQQLQLQILSGSSAYHLYGADISSLSGQTLELALSVSKGGVVFDDIRFSSQPVPEPSGGALAGFALTLLALLRWLRTSVEPRDSVGPFTRSGT